MLVQNAERLQQGTGSNLDNYNTQMCTIFTYKTAKQHKTFVFEHLLQFFNPTVRTQPCE